MLIQGGLGSAEKGNMDCEKIVDFNIEQVFFPGCSLTPTAFIVAALTDETCSTNKYGAGAVISQYQSYFCNT
jgi:hypothetical protein